MGQQDGLEMVVDRILFDFGMILGPVYINLLSSRTLKFRFVLFSGLVSRSFLYRFLNRSFDLGLQSVVCAKNVLQQSTFHGNRF